MSGFKKLFFKQLRNVISILEEKDVTILKTNISHDNYGQEKEIVITIEYDMNQK